LVTKYIESKISNIIKITPVKINPAVNNFFGKPGSLFNIKVLLLFISTVFLIPPFIDLLIKILDKKNKTRKINKNIPVKMAIV
jgi:hypothetical protein